MKYSFDILICLSFVLVHFALAYCIRHMLPLVY